MSKHVHIVGDGISHRPYLATPRVAVRGESGRVEYDASGSALVNDPLSTVTYIAIASCSSTQSRYL